MVEIMFMHIREVINFEDLQAKPVKCFKCEADNNVILDKKDVKFICTKCENENYVYIELNLVGSPF